MFKTDSFATELYESMEKNLLVKQAEEAHGFNKIAKAVDFLNEAAELFDKAGMASESYEVTEVINSFAQAIMPSFTTMPDNWKNVEQDNTMWEGKPVMVNSDGMKYVMTGNMTERILPAHLQNKNNEKSRNRFNLSNQDVEKVQLSLNKVIDKYQGSKPGSLVPDQKWGEQTNKAFDWYNSVTFNSPMQSLKALLSGTTNQETIGGMK